MATPVPSMHSIQNSCIGSYSLCNKTTAGIISVLAITVMALSIIGLTATPSGPFNAIVQLGTRTNGILLGASVFVFTLDLVWIAALCKANVSHSEPSRSRPSLLSHPTPEPLKDETPQTSLAPAIETKNDTDSLNQQLPEEIILRVFGHLTETELAKSGEVCRRWRRIASDVTLWNALDLRKFSPLLQVFDESDWLTHVNLPSFGLDVADAPPLDKRTTIPVLKRCLSSLPIEGNAGVTLLTIPKGLTFNKLVRLAGLPEVGNITQFRFIWNRILAKLGDIPVDKTYRIVITNNVFTGSRNRSITDQKALVSRIGCEMPKVLEATVLLVVTLMSSGKRLYNDNPRTYTRCLEQVSGYKTVVGDFSPDGVHVYISNCDIGSDGASGVLRKF